MEDKSHSLAIFGLCTALRPVGPPVDVEKNSLQVITSQIVAEPVQIQTEPVAAVARQLTHHVCSLLLFVSAFFIVSS